METINNLVQYDYTIIFLGFFAFLFGTKEIVEIVSYFKRKLKVKFGFEKDKEDIETRLGLLERHDNWQYNEIIKISKGIDDIKSRLDLSEKENNQRIIAQYGAELYNLHDKFIKQGYITRAGLETFQLLADTYINAGGNHAIKGKIIPEVLALPIKTEL